MNRFNNARLRMFRPYVAIYDIEVVDKKQDIYKAKLLEIAKDQNVMEGEKTIFFHKKFDPDNNDYDRQYPPFLINDESLIGESFEVIPSDKILFGYEEPSSIQRVPVSAFKQPFMKGR